MSCSDYRALKEIIIKLNYSLSLMSSALKQLWGATVISRLDLCSTYNLIRICVGNEWWKTTTFVTITGDFVYCVMHFGLTKTLSEFHNFMIEVLWEFLHCFIIDDILIYSQSMTIHHVPKVLQRLKAEEILLD